MRKVVHMRPWLSWLGLAGISLVVAGMAAFDVAAMTGYRDPGLHTAAQLPLTAKLVTVADC